MDEAARSHPDFVVPNGGAATGESQPALRCLRRAGCIRRIIKPPWSGNLIGWDWQRQESVFYCVECGEWDLLEGEPWDEALVGPDGFAIVPRDAEVAREWLWFDADPSAASIPSRLDAGDPPEHWSVTDARMHHEGVLAVWPGDVCRVCYKAWH